jgi:hypothetical protein
MAHWHVERLVEPNHADGEVEKTIRRWMAEETRATGLHATSDGCPRMAAHSRKGPCRDGRIGVG